MSDYPSFPRLTAAELQTDLLNILRKIACDTGRVQIMGDDGACDCVLISRAELDALEEALEVLSSTHDVRVLCEHIANVAMLDGNGAVAR